jgi:hypothetical protein
VRAPRAILGAQLIGDGFGERHRVGTEAIDLGLRRTVQRFLIVREDHVAFEIIDLLQSGGRSPSVRVPYQ